MNFFKIYTEAVIRRPVVSLISAFLCCILFLVAAKDVRFNNNFSVLFAVDDEANHYRDFYRTEFGADDGLLMAIIRPETVDEAFFQKLETVTTLLESQIFFKRIISPVNSSVIRNDGVDDEISVDPIFYHFADELTLDEKMLLLRQADTTAGRLVSLHANTFAVLAQMPTQLDSYKKIKQPAEFFQQEIIRMFENTADIHFAGVAYSRIGILDLMHQDLFVLVPLTAIIVAIMSFVLFRTLAVVVINAATIVFSISATLGLMGLNGDDINQLTITFPVLLMVIVVANGIHFYHRYFRELEAGKSVSDAVLITAEQVSKAAFLSCLTTAIGFFALLTADMPILRSFGFYLGCGVLMAFVGLCTIIPGSLQLMQPVKHQSQNHKQLAWVDTMVAFLMRPRCRRWVMLSGFLSLVIGAMVASTIQYDYYLKDMLSENHPQVIASEIADKELSGAFPMEISLLGKAGDFKKADNLKNIY